jgi:hypothetical protein
MEKEHVLDVGQADSLASCKGESHHGTEPVEGEAGGETASECEKCPCESAPEKNWSSTPAVD